ncbi:MAG TPA: hypothetical protein VF614_05240 [Chthoniobacteraceae bacterium]|jgi:hypothetical protein
MSLETFKALLEREIAANEHKGPWEDWQPSADRALRELQIHQEKLRAALTNGGREAISEHCADLALIACKIHERFGAPALEPSTLQHAALAS